MKSLFPALVRYGSSDMLPMHMPGHKRQTGFMHGIAKYDITEVDGFDDLHHPDGVLKAAMAEAAAIYQSDATYFLVNGSTCGLLAAVAAVTQPGEKILIARNCHKAVINAVSLRALDPVYVYPKKSGIFGVDGSIEPKEVKKIFTEEKDICAVVITSPTYEGVVSDISAIAKIAHAKGVPLIVDGAHGAHFQFGRDFPASALESGADLVVESLHKTLPSLTQTALLHVKSNLVDLDEVKYYLQVFQSSSPSYLLIASITECLAIMAKEGEKMMASYSENLFSLRKAVSHLGMVTLLSKEEGFFDYDPGKIIFGVNGYSGKEIAALLRTDFHVETEMTTPRYLVAMTSVYDTKESFFRFQAALSHLCRQLSPGQEMFRGERVIPVAKKIMTPAAARKKQRQSCDLSSSSGRVAAENLYLYPPGTPLVVAGESISGEMAGAIDDYEAQGFLIHGVKNRQLFVIIED